MAEGVGKRIVDALKMQSELEIVDKTQQSDEVIAEDFQSFEDTVTTEDTSAAQEPVFENNYQEPAANNVSYQAPKFQAQNYNSVNTVSPINNVNQMNTNIPPVNAFKNQPSVMADFSNQEVPQNVAILRQLISQLPSGVSRQAGALVIKQTMEALGISMKSVLQEAQQLQESINLSARECQSSILECKKQINNLELQVQQYQKQSSSLNDIISLFVQIN